MTVLDASAILAFLLREPGWQVVGRELADGAACSAVNWSEVAQKVTTAGGDWPMARAALESYDIAVHAATAHDAEWAAARWRRREGLALADRFCLALAHRLGVPAVTADTAWGSSETIRQIR